MRCAQALSDSRRRVDRRIIGGTLGGLVVLIALAGTASRVWAHPLGNFTVNRYARLEPDVGSLGVTYIVDYAEIPTFQELTRVPSLAANPNPEALRLAPEAHQLESQLASAWLAGLHVTAGGQPMVLAIRSTALDFLPGVGGLPTMKLHLRLEGPWPTSGDAAVLYEDTNAPGRLGWREVVLRPATDLPSVDSLASLVDRSQELTNYPADPTAGFPQETTARLQIRGLRSEQPISEAAHAGDATAPLDTLPSGRGPAAAAGALSSGTARGDRLAALITQENWTPTLMIFSLVIAFALGGLHALSPGHGKTIVAAYLVGSHGTAKHALLLGAIVTAAHTAGVFLLGFVTLALSAQIVPETLYPVTQLFSGLAIVGIGATMFLARLRDWPHVHSHGALGEHEHGAGVLHSHSHPGHSHDLPDGSPTVAKLVALGVSGGILPCPSALVVLLSAIALHRVGVGLVLIVAFSIGLASVLSGVGILVVRAGSMLTRFGSASAIVRRVPAMSALFVTVLGLGIAATAFADVQRAFF